jgi:hypothetical protein
MEKALRGTVIFLVTLLVFSTPSLSEAGMKTIWPDQLIPVDTQTAGATIRDPDRIHLTQDIFFGQYYAHVNLPNGARVTKLEYLHIDDITLPGSGTSVSLKRSQHDAGQRTTLWFRAERDAEENSIDFIKVDETDPDSGGRRVRPGYRHWVLVFINGSAAVGSIRIYFE